MKPSLPARPLRGLRLGTAFALLGCGASSLPAAGYLKIDDIPGESKDTGFEGWIDLSAVGAELHRIVAAGVSGAAQLGPVSVTKGIDKSSPYLLQALLKGARLGEVQLDLTRSLEIGGTATWAQFRLHDAGVARLSTDLETEELALNFSGIEWHYRLIDPATGRPLEEIGTYWDLLAGVGGILAETDNRPSIEPFTTLLAEPAGGYQVAVNISDPDTPSTALEVTAVSLDPSLVEVVGISGADAGRMLLLQVNPRRRGGTAIAVTVSDGEHSASRYLPVLIGGAETAYEAFLRASFGDALDAHPEFALPLQDPDEDGLTTIVEFFLGTHPFLPTALRDAIEVHPEKTAEGNRLRLRFFRRTDEPELIGTFHASLDFQKWKALGSDGAPTIEVTVTPLEGQPFAQVDAVIPLGIDPPPAVFLRYVLTGTF